MEHVVELSSSRVERNGDGSVSLREELLVPAGFSGRIDLDAQLVGGDSSSVGRGFVVVRAATPGTAFTVDSLRVPASADDSTDVAAGDIDGDGDIDVVVALDAGISTSALKILSNDGTGHFVDVTASTVPGSARTGRGFAIALGDIDRDGDLDLFLALKASSSQSGTQSRLLLNDGRGYFLEVTQRLPPHLVNGNEAAIVDIDDDGDLDIVHQATWYDTTSFDPRRGYYHSGALVYRNDGAGGFPQELLMPHGDRGLDVGDVDRDGVRDLLVADAYQGVVWFVTSHDPTQGSDLGAMGSGPALGDLDGDGDLDAVMNRSMGSFATNEEMQPRLFVNQDEGTLIERSGSFPLVERAAPGRVTLIADYDSDGDLDVFIAYYDSLHSTRDLQNRLFWNDGTGRFVDGTAAALPPLQDRSHGAALGDFDGDGDLDIFVANRHGGQDYVLLNGLMPAR